MPLDAVMNYSGNKVEPLYPESGGSRAFRFAPNQVIEAGRVLGQISAASAAEIQTLNFGGTVSGGTFTLSITGIDGGTFTTDALDYNISNADLKTAIEALLESAGYAGATVTIGGGECPTDATVTFGGTMLYNNMPLMVATSSLTGDAPTLTVDATQGGNLLGLWVPYDDDGTDDGRRVARAIAQYDFRTDNTGRVVFGASGSPPENGVYHLTAPTWTKGRFKTSELIGLDANGIADLGRLESGTVSNGVLAVI